MMVSAGYIFLFALAIASFHFPGVAAGYNPTGNPYASLEGQLCDPPFGYSRRTCGGEVLLETQSEPVPTFKYGRNVCRVTQTLQSNELEYRYTTACDWVYNYYYHSWVRQCNLECLPLGTCEDVTERIVTKEFTECCEGFTSRPQDDPDLVIFYNYWDVLEPPGCPVAFGPTLRQCMRTQGLDSFLDLFATAKSVCPLLRVLKLEGTEFTVFAPNDSAFDAISDQLDHLNRGEICDLLLNHIVIGSFDADYLKNGKKLQTLGGTTLYVTIVQYYEQLDNQRQIIRMDRFINGAPIILRDACGSDVAGALHIIDGVVMPVEMTLAQVLRNDPSLSNFTNALEAVGLLRPLSSTIPFTVFAPTNEAFENSVYSQELLDCIISDEGQPLMRLLLFHLARGVEYEASLSLQRHWVITFSWQFVLVQMINGTLFLGVDRVELIQSDIRARNGVVHVIDEVLAPPVFDFGVCEPFAPTEPPVTEMPASGSGEPPPLMP